MKIRDAMRRITENAIYLPAIQRKFVWDTDRIEKLFDSIMRGYPIGTFLFWIITEKAKKDYTFYKFIQDFHQRDNSWNEVAPKPDLRNQFIGVLDGQQRLNSMYVALQGSYAYRRKHGRWQDDAAFPQRYFYLNLFHQPSDRDESDLTNHFAFLTSEEAEEVSSKEYWFKVKDVLEWPDTGAVFGFIEAAVSKYERHQKILREHCGPLLIKLWQRLCSDDVINYFSIHEQVLDNIVEIFVRVNSAGVQLSKTDLLFSSIVAHWDRGREEIEAAITTLNEKGNGFAFNNDFVMRTCLALADLPVRLKVNSFKKQNIQTIMTNWSGIKAAMERAVELLVEWGFCGQTLSTLNAVIPIAYFIHKGGDVQQSKDAWRQFLIRAQAKQIFSSASDRVLGKIREALRTSKDKGGTFKLTDRRFTLAQLTAQSELRDLQIYDEDLDEFLDWEKGPYSFMLLSLLYPHLKFDQIQFHQDHIHPRNQFTKKKLKDAGFDDAEIEGCMGKRDLLPNLQLMEGVENKKKNGTELVRWIETLGSAKTHFIRSNYIPPKADLGLKNFEQFFEARKQLLREKLKEVFEI